MNENINKYTTCKVAVSDILKDVFSHFYFADNKSSDVISKILVPSFQTILVFNFGDKVIFNSKERATISIGKCFVLGPIKQAFEYSLKPNSQILVANFKKDASFRFFRTANVTEDLPIDPDEFMCGNSFNTLWISLNKINDIHQRVKYLQEFCRPFLKDRNEIAEKLVSQNDKVYSIESIANQLNQTKRNIQIQHKRILGYSSKEINRYQRFIKGIELIQNSQSSSSKIDWFEILCECGYYDQSHFIRDFKHYLNTSPRQYFNSKQTYCVTNPE